MNFKSLFILIFISTIYSEVPNNNYLWPTNKNKTITTLFGETRSRRFHAGIDVRTFGEIGAKIFAIESGYISRIKISSDGYGKAIYLKLNDGNTVLYAHLDKFNDSIESLSQKLQIENKKNFIDIYFKINEHTINKGDIIGYSGDSGNISGPHLHFEIRDKNGDPINPLTNFYSLSDTLKPIAESLLFIPLDKNCFINGKPNYEILELKPLKYNGSSNIYKYFLKDTVSVVGNFGIAINTYDRMDFSPFDFGIYEIQMLIDNKEMYKINFDKYSFKQDPLIYREIDFNLLTSKSKNFHRLFLNHNSQLDFISDKSNKGINLDKNFHNVVINITDNNKNKIQVQAIIKGDIIISPKSKFNYNGLSLEFDKYQENISFSLSTRYKNSVKIPLKYTIFDSVKYKFDIPENPYEILEYSISNNGIKSNPKYISLIKYDPYKISGKFNIQHFDNNIMINFIEDLFSGYNADLIIEYKNNKKDKKISMERFEKNILSTGLLDINSMSEIEKIHIKYKTKPEIIFSQIIKGKVLKNNHKNYYLFGDFSITANKNSFYNDVFISIEDSYVEIPNIFSKIHPPISIMPNNIPFKNEIVLSYTGKKSGAIFSYNTKKEKWRYIQDQEDDSLIANINSGNIFAILNETKKPKISDIFPSNNSTYNIEDLNYISFNIKDEESGINQNSIKIYLNKILQYYEYIPYRNLIRTNIDKDQIIDENYLEISLKDNIGNEKYYKGIFYKE